MNENPRYPLGVGTDPDPSFASSRLSCLDEREGADAEQPHDQRGSLAAKRLRRRRGQQPTSRLGAVVCREQAAADIAARGNSLGDVDQRDGRRQREQQHGGLSARKRPKILRPSQRRGPPQPADAGRGVGDHPEHECQRHDTAAEFEGHPPRRRELAHQRADADEHGDDRGDREREVRRSARRQPAQNRAHERRGPEEQHAGGDRRHGREERRSSPDRPGQHQFGAPGLLLGPQGPDRRQQAEHCAEDRERTADPPGAVAAHGQQVVRLAVEQNDRLVDPEVARERQPVRERRVRMAIADRLYVGDRSEQIRERDRADARIPQRATGDRQWRLPPRSRRGRPSPRCDRRHGRSGAGRSPRARARGS